MYMVLEQNIIIYYMNAAYVFIMLSQTLLFHIYRIYHPFLYCCQA